MQTMCLNKYLYHSMLYFAVFGYPGKNPVAGDPEVWTCLGNDNSYGYSGFRNDRGVFLSPEIHERCI